MNQNDLRRVKEFVVDPLEAIYGPYTDGMIRVMVEDLAHYADSVLREGVKKVRQSCKAQPRLAHIIEACNEVLPPSQQGRESKDESFHCRGQCEKERPHIAKEILSSPAGQLALELGVAHDLLTDYEKTGRKQFDERYVRKCHEAWKQASSDIARANRETHAAYDRLKGLYDGMCDRERALYANYYKFVPVQNYGYG